MAEHMLNDARIWIGKYDLSTNFNQVTLDHSAESLDNTVMGDTTRSHMGGLKEVTMTATLLKDFTDTTGNDEILDGYFSLAPTTLLPIAVSAEGGDAAEHAFMFRGVLTQVPRLAGTVGDLHVGEISATGCDGVGLVRGHILEDGNTARDTTFSGASQELGAATAAQTIYACIFCTSASAGDTLDVIIESDADDAWGAGATTRITFTQLTTTGYEWKTLAGAVTDTYWRITATIAGVDPSFNFAVIMGIK